jgi:hypothetical protein
MIAKLAAAIDRWFCALRGHDALLQIESPVTHEIAESI